MPTLKQVTCSIISGAEEAKINEYAHRYDDGAVECFIPVPRGEAAFHIRLHTTGYIAPGLAVFVYIDGKYQCNRNKPSSTQRNHRIELQLRQKEDKLHSGDFVGRGWTFTNLERAGEPQHTTGASGENLGTIEVVVLRCQYHHMLRDTAIKSTESKDHNLRKPQRDTKKAASKTSTISNIFGGLLDGASDLASINDGLASTWTNTRSSVDLTGPTHHSVTSYVGFCNNPLSLGFDGYDSDDYNRHQNDGCGYGRPLGSPRPRPGCSFAQYKSSREQKYGQDLENQHEKLCRTTTRAHDNSRSGTQNLATQCLQTVSSIFREIENDMFSQIRIRNDKINFLVNAMKDARENAPDLLDGLSKRHAQLLRENEFQAEESSRLLGTAIGYMATLDDEDWAACREFIIGKGWLEASHPWLNDADRPGNGHLSPQHGRVSSVRGFETDARSKQGEKPSRTGLLNSHATDWQEISSHVQMTAPGEQIGGTQKPNRQDRQWSRHSVTKSIHRNSKASQPRGIGAQTDEQFLRGDDPIGNECHWPDEKNDAWQNDGMQTKAPSTFHGWPQDNGGNQVWNDAKNDRQTPLALNTGTDGASQADEQSLASKSRHKSRTTVSLSEPRRTIKPYWADAIVNHAPSRRDTEQGKIRDPYTYPAEPRPTLPKDSNNRVSVGVQAGKGVDYVHQIGTPEYIDSLQDPYAVFTFKYRTLAELEKILGKRFREAHREETQKAQQEELYSMPKDKLVEELLKARKKIGSTSSPGKAEATWASHHSDVKPADSVSQVKSARNDAGWGPSRSKAPTDNGWAPGNPGTWSEPKENAANDWAKQPSNAGWAPEQKSRLSKSSATVQHFTDSKLRTTGKPEGTGWNASVKSSSRNGAQGFKPDTGNNANANINW